MRAHNRRMADRQMLAGFVAHRTAMLSRARWQDVSRWWRDFLDRAKPVQSKEEWLAELDAFADRHNAHFERAE